MYTEMRQMHVFGSDLKSLTTFAAQHHAAAVYTTSIARVALLAQNDQIQWPHAFEFGPLERFSPITN
jgi:hypothetical protein